MGTGLLAEVLKWSETNVTNARLCKVFASKSILLIGATVPRMK